MKRVIHAIRWKPLGRPPAVLGRRARVAFLNRFTCYVLSVMGLAFGLIAFTLPRPAYG